MGHNALLKEIFIFVSCVASVLLIVVLSQFLSPEPTATYEVIDTRLSTISLGLKQFYIDNKRLPKDQSEFYFLFGSSNPYFEPDDKFDPWNEPIRYFRITENEVKLLSTGPDKTIMTSDDKSITVIIPH